MKKTSTIAAYFILFISFLFYLGVQITHAGIITEFIQKLFTKEAKNITEQAAKNEIENVTKKEAENATENSVANSAKRIATRTTGGSSAVLGSRIGIKKTGEWAAHHIIPVELKNHPILNKIGMDMDEIFNGIALPTKPGIDSKLPLHSGSHPGYTAGIAQELDAIPANLTVDETQRKVRAIQNKFKKELESGKPLHQKYGAPDPWY